MHDVYVGFGQVVWLYAAHDVHARAAWKLHKVRNFAFPVAHEVRRRYDYRRERVFGA